jgi:four helix bundle protein
MLSFQPLDVYQRAIEWGRWSEADMANRYKIARGEAMECAASLDVMRLRKLINDARYARGSQLIEGVIAMLTK